MIRRPPRSTRTDTVFPYTTLFRARWWCYMSRRTAALGEGLNDGWHVIIVIRDPNDGQVATEAQIARQVRPVGDLRLHHKRSCHLDAREVAPLTHVVDAIAHPLVRLYPLTWHDILADLLAGGCSLG